MDTSKGEGFFGLEKNSLCLKKGVSFFYPHYHVSRNSIC